MIKWKMGKKIFRIMLISILSIILYLNLINALPHNDFFIYLIDPANTITSANVTGSCSPDANDTNCTLNVYDCSLEGWWKAIFQGGGENSSIENNFFVNYDADQTDCECLGGLWTGDACCGDDGGYQNDIDCFFNIGLRTYDGNSIENLLAYRLYSPLRIAKNGTKYNLSLVDTSHKLASNTKIRANLLEETQPDSDTQLLAHFNPTEYSADANTVLLYHLNSYQFNDDSGNNNHGYCNATASECPIKTIGRLNDGFKFDGVDDYVNIPYSTTFGSIGNRITVSVWIKIKSPVYGSPYTGSHIIGRWQNPWPWIMDLNTSNYVRWNVPESGTTDRVVRYGPLNLNQWYNLVGTFNGSHNVLYVNGILVGSTPRLDINISDSASINLDIGKRTDANQLYFNGTIDEVIIWNRSLNTTEVKRLYARQAGFYDDSGNDNYGTPVNSPDFIPISVLGSHAIDFTTQTNDYVNLGTSSTLDLTGDFTFSFWTKINGSSTRNSIYSRPGNLWIRTNNDLRLGIETGGSPWNAVSLNLSDALQLDIWYHIAITHRTSDNLTKIYVNGEHKKNGTLNLPSNPSATAYLGSYATISHNFNGYLDEFVAYNRSLSESEVKELYMGSEKTVALKKQIVSEWNKTWGGTQLDEIYGIKVDTNDDVFVTGVEYGSGSFDDFYIAKILKNSTLEWQDQQEWVTDEDGREIILDEKNNKIYAVGRYCCWNFNFAEYNYSQGIYNTKYTSGISGRDMSHGFSRDSSGDFYLVGRVEEVAGVPPYNYRAMKYDITSGVNWSNKIGLTGVEELFYDSTLDEKENLYAVGYNANNNNDFTFFKFNPDNGSEIWNNSFSTSGDEIGYNIVSDQNGYLYAVGYTNNSGDYDVLLLKINQSDGSIVWNETFDNGNNDRAEDLIYDNGKIYIAASTNTTNGDWDYWLIGYYPETRKTFLDYKHGSSDDEYAYALDVDSNSNIYVGGYHYNGTDAEDFYLVKFNLV